MELSGLSNFGVVFVVVAVAGIRSSFEVHVNDEFGRAVRGGPHTLKARVLVCPDRERTPDWTAPIQWSQKAPLPVKASQVLSLLFAVSCFCDAVLICCVVSCSWLRRCPAIQCCCSVGTLPPVNS